LLAALGLNFLVLSALLADHWRLELLHLGDDLLLWVVKHLLLLEVSCSGKVSLGWLGPVLGK
jgi:hypothetical protein